MATASAAFTFEGASGSLLVLETTDGATVTATLDSLDGVSTVAWSVYSTDETTDVGDYALTTSGPKGSIVTFAAGSAGTAGLLQCRINGGINPQTGATEAAYTKRAKWHVPTDGGLEVGCVDEAFESDPIFGTTGIVNAAVRSVGAGSSVTSVTGTAPIVSSGGATPAISISAANGSGPGSMSVDHYTLCAGATDAATVSTLVKRDAAGRFKAVAGVASDDVAVVSQLSSGGGWQVGYSVDFGALAGANLLSGGDGVKTIDGKAWTLAGSANAAALDVVPGTGIVGSSAGGGNSVGLWIPLTTLAALATMSDRDICVIAHMKRTTIGNNQPSQLLCALSQLPGQATFPASSMYGALDTTDSTSAYPTVATLGYGNYVDQSYKDGTAIEEVVTAWQVPAGAARGDGFFKAVGAIPSSIASLKSAVNYHCPRTAGNPVALWTGEDPHVYLRWYSGGGTSVWAICGLTVLYR